jgi:predicted MFS family arabinose efflux permease
LRNRWGILAVLFTVRLTMAFQFQSVAAVAPLLGAKFGVSLADIGLLIGLYFTPGVALALPGGAIGQRFGDKATVLAALTLMLIGGLAMALSDSWGMQITGRLVAGAGGVLLNVLMSKMLTDWFAGKEISTAMGIFVTSWPVGLALALLTLPPLGTAYGIAAPFLAVTALTASGIIVIGLVYHPPGQSAATAMASVWLDRHAAAAVITAGLIWGLFNAGFAMIFSFGPAMLAERGWSISAAGSSISIVLWLGLLSVPAGGYLADRTRRPQFILVAGCLIFVVLMLALPRAGAVISIIVALGLLTGLPAGPIMSLPAQVLQPTTRAIGMGLFYTVYYATMMLGAMVGGACAKWAGSAAAAFDFGAAVLLACPLLLWLFNRIAPARM